MVTLRVAYLLGTTEGGIGRHVAMLASGCARAGLDVRVLGPPAGPRPAMPPSAVPPSAVPPLAGSPGSAESGLVRPIGCEAVMIGDRPRPARDAAAVRRVRRLLIGIEPHVVHAHGLRAGAVAALALRPFPGARWPGKRPSLVVTVHNAAPPGVARTAVYRTLERLVARRADAVLCVSEDLSARMRGRSARYVDRAVVPAPRTTGSWPVPREQVAASAAGRPVVFAAGRLAPQKGFDVLLEAAARWRGRRPEPLLLVAGAGPLAGHLASQARELGVAAEFVGHRDDVPALLAAADVVVLPSRWEGQSLLLQEALAAGRPVVATDVGGVREVTGDAALLVPVADPAALAAAILRILDDPDLAVALGAAAAARAATLPDEADAVAAVLAVYRRLAGAGR